MRIPKKNTYSTLIVIIFTMAVFNDVIRIPNTVISGYRLMLPIALCIILYNFRFIWKYFLFACSMIFLLISQNIIYSNNFKLELTIDFLWQLRYLFYYFSIIVLFILMRILRKNNNMVFQQLFYRGIPILGIICMLIYISSAFQEFKYVNSANLNNYGACLAAVFPWFFTDLFHGKRCSIFFCIVIVMALFLGDSKASLAGVLLQVVVIVSIILTKKFKEGNKVLAVIVPVGIFICLAIALSPIKINNYPIRMMFTEMVSHILKGEIYIRNSSSLTYRTNAIIYMLSGIKKSYFMGVGIGNTGKILRQSMPEIVLETKFTLGFKALSPHCAWLEFWCDCGIWAIILCLYIYIIAIKKLFHAKGLDRIDIFFVAFTLSFPMWVMGPSGIYTIYLIFIIIAWLYEWSRMKCQLTKKMLSVTP